MKAATEIEREKAEREPSKWQDLAKPVCRVMSDLARRLTHGR